MQLLSEEDLTIPPEYQIKEAFISFIQRSQHDEHCRLCNRAEVRQLALHAQSSEQLDTEPHNQLP